MGIWNGSMQIRMELKAYWTWVRPSGHQADKLRCQLFMKILSLKQESTTPKRPKKNPTYH